MTAKEYLSQAYRLDLRINSKLEQAVSLKELATKATSRIHAERVSGTNRRSSMENALIKIIDLEREIDREVDRLIDIKARIASLITAIDDPLFRLLLELRYLKGEKWDEISKIMGYNLRWIYRLHGRALIAADQELISMQSKRTSTSVVK